MYFVVSVVEFKPEDIDTFPKITVYGVRPFVFLDMKSADTFIYNAINGYSDKGYEVYAKPSDQQNAIHGLKKNIVLVPNPILASKGLNALMFEASIVDYKHHESKPRDSVPDYESLSDNAKNLINSIFDDGEDEKVNG